MDMIDNKYKTPSIWFSLVVVSILFLPFLSKVFNSEIYPSIILPSGNGLLKIVDNNTTVNEVKFFAIKNSTSKEIPKSIIFKKVHRKNYGSLTKSVLRFSKLESRKKDHKIENLSNWLFKNVGYEFDSLKINFYKNKYHLNPLKKIKEHKVKSEIFKLTKR